LQPVLTLNNRYKGATAETVPLFESELLAMINSRGNHPRWDLNLDRDTDIEILIDIDIETKGSKRR